MSMRLAIANDHAGTVYKQAVCSFLKDKTYAVLDCGTDGMGSVDYPDFAHQVAQSVDRGISSFGILLCGSGNGVAMTANKYSKVRAAVCWTKELVALARQHNDANILCIPARFVSCEQTLEMVDCFLNTSFEGGRHQRRIEKIKEVSDYKRYC